jgi:hypothetical protein
VNHVLAVLGDEQKDLWMTFDRAVALADAGNARLTLAKTTDPGRVVRWFAPASWSSMMVSPADLQFERIAGDMLARAVEFVPVWMPVTTVLLGLPTLRALRDLTRRGRYDALVCGDALLTHSPRLRRDLRRNDVDTVVTVSSYARPWNWRPSLVLPDPHHGARA